MPDPDNLYGPYGERGTHSLTNEQLRNMMEAGEKLGFTPAEVQKQIRDDLRIQPPHAQQRPAEAGNALRVDGDVISAPDVRHRAAATSNEEDDLAVVVFVNGVLGIKQNGSITLI